MNFKIGDVIENTSPEPLRSGRLWRIIGENGPHFFVIESVEFPGNTMSLSRPVWQLVNDPT